MLRSSRLCRLTYWRALSPLPCWRELQGRSERSGEARGWFSGDKGWKGNSSEEQVAPRVGGARGGVDVIR